MLEKQIKQFTNKRWVYDIWLEKFGKEVADEKLIALKKKQSANASGDKNPMFGKPSPQGSGNGWSGWYKNWYFKSLRELSYMVNVIEQNNLRWSVPDSNFKISYEDFNGNKRTYTPDFIINDIELVEIKPKKLHTSPLVLLKKKAAEEFVINIGMKYLIVDAPMLNNIEIIEFYLNDKIKFIKRYEDKFKERFLNAKNSTNGGDACKL